MAGRLYDPKEPQPVDEAESLKWLQFGAENGIPAAQVVLAGKYAEGRGVPQNYPEAVRLLEQAAFHEGEWMKANPFVQRARMTLGDMYQTGKGAAKSPETAVKCYRLSADDGYADAEFKMGEAYVKGLGVPQSDSEGANYYRSAAEQGNRPAQAALGAMYFSGQGVQQDYVQAHLWTGLAAAGGDDRLVKLRKEIEQKMTPVQIAEAQLLEKNWKPKENR
jgi:TPR repeat protein